MPFDPYECDLNWELFDWCHDLVNHVLFREETVVGEGSFASHKLLEPLNNTSSIEVMFDYVMAWNGVPM